MASPALIVPLAPPALAPSDTHWRDALLDEYAALHRQCRAELRSDHPGSFLVVADLLHRAANIAADLAELDGRGGHS